METHNNLTRHVLMRLEDALSKEHHFQPCLLLPVISQSKTDITCGMRDGSAQVLRCLKLWFDLPSEVLVLATYSMDRFLSKMKALRKHLACIAVSALHVAAESLMIEQSPSLRELATISQCGCTERDLARMSILIRSKLGPEIPTTPLLYLTIFTKFLELKDIFTSPESESLLHHKLEILACDASCSNFRPCELALVVLHIEIQDPALNSTPEQMHLLAEHMVLLQQVCQIEESNFLCCHEVVSRTFDQYNGQSQMPFRQRLVWRMSQRTMRYLRPTSKLIHALPTIEENGPLNLHSDRQRYIRSQSLSSEESFEQEREEADWGSTRDVRKWNLNA